MTLSGKASSGTDLPMALWERNLLGVKLSHIHLLLPGLLVAALISWPSIWLSQYVGVTLLGFTKSPISPSMVVIILGLIVAHAVPLPAWFKPGLTFVVKKVLRLGIILLGIRLSIFDVLKLGTLGVPIVVLSIVGALLFTTFLNRRLGLPERLGTLIAVGTSICGASAIVAAGPAIDATDEEVSYALAVITLFGVVATLAYPYVAFALFAGDPVRAGLFLGTSIHETAQVTGAAMVFADLYSLPRGLDVATITKMVRNVFMAFVIPFMAFYYHRRSAGPGESERKGPGTRELFPLFIIGFMVFAALRSIGDASVKSGAEAFGLWDSAAWTQVYDSIKQWASTLLVLALAGVGLNTRFRALRDLGAKPFVVGLAAALMVGVLSAVTISLLGALVAF